MSNGSPNGGQDDDLNENSAETPDQGGADVEGGEHLEQIGGGQPVDQPKAETRHESGETMSAESESSAFEAVQERYIRLMACLRESTTDVLNVGAEWIQKRWKQLLEYYTVVEADSQTQSLGAQHILTFAVYDPNHVDTSAINTGDNCVIYLPNNLSDMEALQLIVEQLMQVPDSTEFPQPSAPTVMMINEADKQLYAEALAATEYFSNLPAMASPEPGQQSTVRMDVEQLADIHRDHFAQIPPESLNRDTIVTHVLLYLYAFIYQTLPQDSQEQSRITGLANNRATCLKTAEETADKLMMELVGAKQPEWNKGPWDIEVWQTKLDAFKQCVSRMQSDGAVGVLGVNKDLIQQAFTRAADVILSTRTGETAVNLTIQPGQYAFTFSVGTPETDEFIPYTRTAQTFEADLFSGRHLRSAGLPEPLVTMYLAQQMGAVSVVNTSLDKPTNDDEISSQSIGTFCAIDAAEYLSNGRFVAAFKTLGITHEDDFVNYSLQRLLEIVRTLDQSLGLAPPASLHDAAVRLDIYFYAIQLLAASEHMGPPIAGKTNVKTGRIAAATYKLHEVAEFMVKYPDLYTAQNPETVLSPVDRMKWYADQAMQVAHVKLQEINIEGFDASDFGGLLEYVRDQLIAIYFERTDWRLYSTDITVPGDTKTVAEDGRFQAFWTKPMC